MLGDITAADEIYIVTGRTDMRKSIDGLCAIVEDQLHMDPRRSALYLFCGKRCDRIKALLWESDGFVLLYKRMEVQGRFRWPRNQLSTLTFIRLPSTSIGVAVSTAFRGIVLVTSASISSTSMVIFSTSSSPQPSLRSR